MDSAVHVEKEKLKILSYSWPRPILQIANLNHKSISKSIGQWSEPMISDNMLIAVILDNNLELTKK